MIKIPALKAKDIIKVLNKLGFIEIRQKGSHKFVKHPDGRTTVVPYRPGEDISRALFKEILKDINIKSRRLYGVIKKEIKLGLK